MRSGLRTGLALGCALAFVVACSDPGSPGEIADAGADPADASGSGDAADAAVNPVQDASMQDAADASVPDADVPEVWVPPPPPDAPSGPFADAASACEPESVPALCARIGAECGNVDAVDLCGDARTVACGACPSGSVCGGGSTPNRCASCTVETDAELCARLGKNCGSVTATDNCGTSRSVACGTCGANEQCQPSNVCACVAETNAAFCTRSGANCGVLAGTDNCGSPRSADCGTCSGGASCGGSGSANVCGVAPVCAAPASTPSFPTLTVPGSAPFAQGACASAQTGAFFDACLASGSTAAACGAWQAANAGCRACLVTSESGTAYGPLVVRAALVDAAQNPLGLSDASVSLGVASCLERVSSGCGVAYFRHEACLEASCDSNAACFAAAASTVDACRSAAQSGACAGTYAAAFAAGAGACTGAVSTGGASLAGDNCLPTASERATLTDAGFRTFFLRVASKFCGP